jgi:hypothetical protein
MSRFVGRNSVRSDAAALAGVGALLGLLATAAADADVPAVQPASAPAAEQLQWSAEVDAGVEHTSNLNRSEQSPESATFATATGNYKLVEQTQYLYADVATVDTWRDLPAGTPGGDLTPSLDAFLIWTPVSDVFSWRLTDNLGEIAPNSNGALAQPDRERVNVASTGPSLQLPLGSNNVFTASARYSRVNFQTTTLDDGYRLAGQTGVGRVLGIGGVLSLNVTDVRTAADANAVPFNVGTVYANYTQSDVRGSIDGDLGVSRLTNVANTPTGIYADIRLTRKLTPRTSVIFDFVHRYADLAAVFTRQQDLDVNVGDIQNAQASGQVVRESSVALGVSWTARRTQVVVSGYQYSEKQYNGGPVSLNETGANFYADVEFRLRPDLSLGAGGFAKFWSAPGDSGARDLAYSAHATWQFLEHVGMVVGVERYSQANVPGNDYQETRYYASVIWRLNRGDPVSRHREFDSPELRRIQYVR